MSTLGSLVVTLEGNTARFESDLGRAAAVAAARSKEMERSFGMVDRAITSQRGLSANVLQPYIKQLDAVGVSAAQTAAALRGVPAQFTDIVTSLQGGQQPLTVLLQQGGQLKDMFGGIVPAAKALGGYVAGLITPLNLAAAAAATLAVAMFQGSQEAQAYAKALTLTGNYLGLTTDQLAAMAAQIARTTGTQGQAAEALAALANSGKIASGSLTEVGAAVVSMNRVLGTSIDEAAAVFTKLADEPAKASAKLNESMHYLTEATYARIRALEEQGQKEEAAALAQTTYASATNSRLASVEAQAGFLARMWRALAHDAKEAWDMMQGLGRPKSTGEMLADAQKALADRQARGPLNNLTGEAYAKGVAALHDRITDLTKKGLREQENAYAEGERARTEAQKIGASDRLKALATEIQSNADKRKKAIDQINKDFKEMGTEAAMKAADGKTQAELIAAANEKFKDPKGAKAKAFQDDAGTKYLETLRQTEASLKVQLAGEEKITEAEKDQVKFQQLIADLKDKKVLTADQKSLLANKDAILVQLRQNTALADQIEIKKKAEKLDEKRKKDAEDFARQIEGINISIASSNESRADQQDRALAAFGLGDRARAEVEAQKSIRQEFERYKRQLTKQAAEKGQLGSDAYQREVDRIKSSLDEALAAQEAYFAILKAKQGDWVNGATTALQNYIDQIDNVSAQTEKAFTDGFKGAEDALVTFVTKGKGDVKSLINSIIADLARLAIQQAITGPIAKGLAGLFNGGGGGTPVSFDSIADLYGGPHAAGGNVTGDKFYLVGEKGPELFAPNASGTIIPNDALTGGGGGGAPVVNNYNFTVGDVATVSMVRQAIATSQRQAAGKLVRSKTHGGVMAQ